MSSADNILFLYVFLVTYWSTLVYELYSHMILLNWIPMYSDCCYLRVQQRQQGYILTGVRLFVYKCLLATLTYTLLLNNFQVSCKPAKHPRLWEKTRKSRITENSLIFSYKPVGHSNPVWLHSQTRYRIALAMSPRRCAVRFLTNFRHCLNPYNILCLKPNPNVSPNEF